MRLSEHSFLGRRAIDLLAVYGVAARAAHPPRRLLLTTTGGLGDGVLLSSIIQHLRRHDPALEIEAFARYGAAVALELLPDLPIYRGEVRANSQLNVLTTARHLRQRRYDAALATDQVATAIAAALCLARIPRRIGFAPLRQSRQPQLYSDVIRLDVCGSQWSALVRLGQKLLPALPDSIEPLPLPVAAEAEQRVADWRRCELDGAGPVVAFHVGASADYRRWPLDAFVALAARLRQITPAMALVLTGTAAERDLFESFTRSYPGLALAFASRTLGETAALLRGCDLLVANDSGVMHLGAAMGAPTVGLFGPNTPARWAPRGPHAYAVYAGAPCSPCIDNFRGPALRQRDLATVPARRFRRCRSRRSPRDRRAMAHVSSPARLRDLMYTGSRLRYLAWRAARSPRPLAVALKTGVRLMLRPPPAGDLSVAHEIFVQQCYRAPRPLDPSALRTIVDVGANCGFSLLYFAHRFPLAELVAFEPHPVHQRQIEDHMRLNALDGRVTLIPAAAGCAAGPAFLSDEGERSQIVKQSAQHIPIRTVDFFDAIGVRSVDLLKLDCEGAEHDLLMDPRFAALQIRALVMECHPHADHPDVSMELRARLRQLRFSLTPETAAKSCAGEILWAFAAPARVAV